MSFYRGMDRAALDAAYNNSAAVPDSAEFMAAFRARGDRLRAGMSQHLDLRYGLAPRNCIDYFPTAPGGPVLIFIHGGFWQMRAKEDFAVLARGLLPHGIHVAMVGYTLAPDINLSGIVGEIRSAIRWLAPRVAELGGDTDRIFLAGWSAGAHLTAIALDEPAVNGGLAISGIYELEPMRHCYINDKLQLDIDEVDRLSPLRHVGAAKPLLLAYGDGELPEMQRQTEAYAAARERAKLPGRLVALPRHNHFTILEELADPDGALALLANELVTS